MISKSTGRPPEGTSMLPVNVGNSQITQSAQLMLDALEQGTPMVPVSSPSTFGPPASSAQQIDVIERMFAQILGVVAKP